MKPHKRNCWEFKKCGREVGGKNAGTMGVCPVALEKRADGINGGANGGRACWALTGTFCNGGKKESYPEKVRDCINCAFYKSVLYEEGISFVPSIEIHEIIDNSRYLSLATRR